LILDRLWEWLSEYRNGKLHLKEILPEVLAFLIPTAGWAVFAALYFGSPVPHSVAAKSLAYRLGPEAGFVRLLQHYATPFQEHQTFGIPWIGVGLILHPFLYILGGKRAFQTISHIWPLLAYPWLYFAIFSVANPLIFRWYLTPPLPAYILFILGGGEVLVFAIAFAVKKRSQPESKVITPGKLTDLATVLLVILLPFLLSLKGWRFHPDHGIDRPAPEMAWYKLELLYRQAAEGLPVQKSGSGDSQPTLAAGDVGVLGFLTGMRILDTVGLNSPQTTKYYPIDPAYYVINYAVPPQLILDALPDYIVLLEVYGRAGLFKNPDFWENYRLREKIPTDIYGSDGMLIFEKVEP
jgi:hypothetical protein